MRHIQELILYSLSLGTNKLACVNPNDKIFQHEPDHVVPVVDTSVEPHVDNSHDEYGFMNLYGDEKRSSLS